MPSTTEQLVAELGQVFRQAPHRRAAHHAARPLLEQASREPGLISEALERYLAKPESLNRLNYPVVALPVASNADFELVINCWIPLPTGSTDVTTKAIHHHGDLLLSTATIFGAGYEHWMFSQPRLRSGGLYSMAVVQAGTHRLHEVAFVDSLVPHVPIYPPELSLTLALWSSRFDKSWKDRAKKLPFLRKNAARLRSWGIAAGLKGALDLKQARDFDFFPTNGGFEVLRDRIEFALGPNADHLHSLFHVLQQTGNARLGQAVATHLSAGSLAAPGVVGELLGKLAADEPIAGKLSDGHYGVSFANFTTADILRVVDREQTYGS